MKTVVIYYVVARKREIEETYTDGEHARDKILPPQRVLPCSRAIKRVQESFERKCKGLEIKGIVLFLI